MNRTRLTQKSRLGLIGFLVVSVLLAIGSIWSHQRLLGGVYQTEPQTTPDRTGQVGPVRALIFHSTATAQFTGNEPYQRALATQWQDLLATERITAEIVTDWPDATGHTRYDLLILPAVSCMSDADKEWVKSFLRSGGGVIMSWAAGVRDERGEWRTQSLLAHVGGMSPGPTPPLTGEPAYASMILSAQTPLTHGLPPGLALQVRDYGEPLTGHAHEPRAQVSARWRTADATIWCRPDDATANLPGAIVHGTYQGGRFVWLGFADLAAVTHSDYPQAAARLARNALRWASRRPRATKPLWPQRAGSAFSISIALHQLEDLDSPLWELIRLHRAPFTLFATPECWAQQARFLNRLPPWGELALLDDHPAQRTEPYALRSEIRRLRDLRRRVQSSLADGPQQIGYRAADGQHAEELLSALARARFHYTVTRKTAAMHPRLARTHRPVPFVTRPHELWQLTEICLIDLLGDDADDATDLLTAFNAAHNAGGHFNLWINAQRLNDAHLAQLDLFLHQIKQQNTWLAPVGSVHAFWRQWGHIDIATTQDAAGRTSIHISNSGLETVHEATFFIDIDADADQVVLQPLTVGSPAVRATPTDPVRWEIHFSQIPPGKNYSYQLELR